MVAECQRQEESCLYTSTALFEWLKALRQGRTCFVVAPIVLSGIASAALVKQSAGYAWVAGLAATFAGMATAVYKALGLDVNLSEVVAQAHQFKVLQDRFRQAWRVTSLGPAEQFQKEFDKLRDRMDAAREKSLTPPERHFNAAREKIENGDYKFAADPTAKGASRRKDKR